jgi:hypothetical protein
MSKYNIEFTDKLMQNSYESLRKEGFNRLEAIRLTIEDDTAEEQKRLAHYEGV